MMKVDACLTEFHRLEIQLIFYDFLLNCLTIFRLALEEKLHGR